MEVCIMALNCCAGLVMKAWKCSTPTMFCAYWSMRSRSEAVT